MICDKCGFEHNSKSVCPKCGARVVYVNEEYQKRRKEWEESQKNQAIPPLIMHSTREDYDRRHGNDRTTNLDRANKEDRSEKAGLSFDVSQIISKLGKFFSGLGKRISAAVSTLKEKNDKAKKRSNFKQKRIIAIAGAVLLTVIAAIVIITVVRHRDRSRVAYYDGKYMYSGTGDRLIDTESNNVVITEVANDVFLLSSNQRIVTCVRGKENVLEVKNADVMAYSGDLDKLLYSLADGVYLYDGDESVKLCSFTGQGADSSSMMSDNGEYGVFTICSDSDDFSSGEYTTYFFANDSELVQIAKDYNSKEIIDVSDDGKVIYTDMATADYGIINSREIKIYSAGENRTLVDNAVQFKKVGEDIFYTDSVNNLNRVGIDGGKKSQVDMDVDILLGNEIDSTDVIYSKKSGIYRLKDNKPQLLAKQSGNVIVYYDSKTDIYLCRQERTVYNEKNEAVCTLMNDSSMVWTDEGVLLLDDDGNLGLYDTILEKIDEGVSFVTKVENGRGFIFGKDGATYLVKKNGKKAKRLLGFDEGCKKIIYSRKKYYLMNGDSILYRISKKDKYDTIGKVNELYLIK